MRVLVSMRVVPEQMQLELVNRRVIKQHVCFVTYTYWTFHWKLVFREFVFCCNVLFNTFWSRPVTCTEWTDVRISHCAVFFIEMLFESRSEHKRAGAFGTVEALFFVGSLSVCNAFMVAESSRCSVA